MDPEAEIEKRLYCEITDKTKLQGVMNDYLDDFNTMNKVPMPLVLFFNAVEHLSRISRIINQPGGNALLVGMGGSGRKSVCTLACWIQEQLKPFQIEITKSYGVFEWHEDLKSILRSAGALGNATVFLFSDTQIVKPSFVEDINNLLNTGEVPNLFPPDERAALLDEAGVNAKRNGMDVNNMTDSDMWTFFVSQCRKHLHIVLAFSPIGDAFRERLRMFPSLLNCCTVDWFSTWPAEALRSVAEHFFADVQLKPEVKEGVLEVCVDMQERVFKMTKTFEAELGRYY